jgi:hypothetical protein
MTRAEGYRQRAKEAEEQANKTRDAFTKQSFLNIARQWGALATEVERQWPVTSRS